MKLGIKLEQYYFNAKINNFEFRQILLSNFQNKIDSRWVTTPILGDPQMKTL